MTAATQTIAAFLLARIAEDEAVARAEAEQRRRRLAERLGASIAFTEWDIASSPARVLAVCEAHRRIVERLTSLAAASPIVEYSDADVALVDTLRALALPYADHPDYRAEWAL